MNGVDQQSIQLIRCLNRITIERSKDLLQCKYCQRCSSDFDLYKRHIRRHEKYYHPFWQASRSKGSGPKSSDARDNVPCYCLEGFEDVQDLISHNTSHPYQCHMCQRCFSSIASYLHHTSSTHGTRLPKSNNSTKLISASLKPIVPVSLHTQNSEVVSSSSLTESKPTSHFCKSCRLIFATEDALSEHNNGYSFYCSDCQTCLQSVSEFLDHLKMHRNEKKYGLSKNNVSPKHEKNCQVNIKSEHSNTSQKRKGTQQKSQNRFSAKTTVIRKHSSNVGQNGPLQVPPPADPSTRIKRGRPKTCKFCKQSFQCNSLYRLHKCIARYQYKCTFTSCGKNSCFASDEDLSLHVKMDHECPHCQREVDKLQQHIQRFHQMPCPHCQELFVSQTDLYQHVDSVHLCQYCYGRKYFPSVSEHESEKHEDKLYHCLCKRRFPSKSELSSHVFEQHDYTCELCQKKYYAKRKLDKHLLDYHRHQALSWFDGQYNISTTMK